MFMVAMVATISNSYAQYASDALRFSQTNYGSTARFKAMGNAQIGVGGDMSSLGGNPAGLGLFTRSEFSLTPEFNGSDVRANYLNQSTKTTSGKANLSQLGAVFYAPTYKQRGENTKKGVVSAVFGIGYNRNNDYSTEINYTGSNNRTSMADYFAESAGSVAPNKLTDRSAERLAYDNYLISFDNVANNYFPETFADASQSNIQRKNEIKSGSVSEFNFSAAVNISNQVYLGATIGLVDLKYNSDAQYEESGKAREYNAAGVLTGANTNYKFLFNQNQTTKGSGVNGKIGAIFRLVDNLRLGATLQTPTWFVIDDDYTEELDNRGTLRGTSGSKNYPYSYKLRTPLKGSLGASYIIAGQALISADIDVVDYASTKFSSTDGYSGNPVIVENNKAVKNNYQSAINYRIGAEYKINSIALRAGYGVNGSPYKNDSDGYFDVQTYTAGLGYRVKNYFIDLAYQNLSVNNTLNPYVLSNGTEPAADVKSTKNNVFLTFGLRF